MTKKLKWEDHYWGSDYQINRRAKLERVARQVAKRTGKDKDDVLRVLVNEYVRERHADCPGAIPSAVEFEMRLHCTSSEPFGLIAC